MHTPVLQKEVIEYLDPKPNQNFIDCTIGEAGHALEIIEKIGPKGRILGIDADPKQIENCKLKIGNLKKRVILARDNFTSLKEIAKREKFYQVSGILFDLGMSSWHLESSGRGFSFMKNEPLDMRYNVQNPLTAEKILNYWSGVELVKILKDYGQESFAEKIVEGILAFRRTRQIKTTGHLTEIIKRATPSWYQRGKINPATKTFQALRIGVNDELGNLKKALPQALEIIQKEGRIAVISFHSLEDRIVKKFFRERFSENTLKILTKKPITPSFEEIKINPRSRSAKLRAATKI